MKVLIVDDSPIYRKLIRDRLQAWGFESTEVESGSKAWETLQRPDCPKLVLLDWVLPDLDGIELCQRIRNASASRPYVYVILLTGKDGRANMLKAMEAGVDDYLAKPFDESELKARLLVGKRILELQQELISARESMRHAATHDFLTGLLNRGEVMGFLTRELARSKRDSKPIGIILADVDHFKSINDTCGHLYGDEALKEIARRFRAKLRVYDAVGRYGGEEFLLILPGCDAMMTVIRADDMRGHVAITPVVSANTSRVITISVGVVSSEQGGTAEELLTQADCGLYRAKQKGRNRVEHVEHEITT
ncbi:MAG TPA: diguanylate cyclase [Candidatus Acidoferrum sp.]|nr:diguanylate cyclase [Candidatus Acidoferrum sp.]